MLINKILNIFIILLSLIANNSYGQQMPKAIAHALGSIDGNTYTNSREAMIRSIEKGYKYIEVDIDSTSDGIMIASHDWARFNSITNCGHLKDTVVSYEEFSKRKIYGKYTPVTIKEVVDTMMNHPEISIVTDKVSDPEIIERLFSGMKERVYVECFSESDYFELKERGYHTMFSLYYADNSFSYIIQNLLKGKGRIDFFTTSTYQNFNEFKKFRCLFPFQVAMFTINDDEFLDEHINEIDFFYSDFYDPSTNTFSEH